MFHLATTAYFAANSYVKDLGAKDVLPSRSNNIGDALANVMVVVIYLVGALSVVFIVVGALQIVASAGSPQRVKQGRETIIYAVVGVIISIAAYAIVHFVADQAFSG